MAKLVYVVRGADSGGDGTTNATSSGDGSHAYQSFVIAEAAEQADLTIADGVKFILAGGADSGEVTFDSANWTTDATRFITIVLADSDKHGSTLDLAKYHRITTSNYQDLLLIDVPFTVVQGIQFKLDHIGAYGVRSTAANGTYIDNLIQGNDGANQRGVSHSVSGLGTEQVNIVNNVIYDCGKRGIEITGSNSSSTLVIYNNTLVSNDIGIWTGSTHNSASRLFNNISTGSTTDFQAYGSYTTGGNISSDSTSPDTSLRNIVVTYTDAGNDDYSTDDSDVVGAGDDLSSDSLFPFSTDTLGLDRVAWDIGAFEDGATSGGGSPVLTSPTASSISASKVTPGVTTDGDDGAIRYVLSLSTASIPTATQIIAGDDGDDLAGIAVGNQTVTVTGAQAFAEITPNLTAGVNYRISYAHTAASNDDSNVVNITFTASDLVALFPNSGSDTTGLEYKVFSTTTLSTSTQIDSGSDAAIVSNVTTINLNGLASLGDSVLLVTGDFTTSPTGASEASVCFVTVTEA